MPTDSNGSRADAALVERDSVDVYLAAWRDGGGTAYRMILSAIAIGVLCTPFVEIPVVVRVPRRHAPEPHLARSQGFRHFLRHHGLLRPECGITTWRQPNGVEPEPHAPAGVERIAFDDGQVRNLAGLDTAVVLVLFELAVAQVAPEHGGHAQLVGVGERLGDLDPVSEDMLIGHAGELEKFQWFVRAHLESVISHGTPPIRWLRRILLGGEAAAA